MGAMPRQGFWARLGTISGLLSLPALAAGIYCALGYAPTEKVMGDVQRIFYFHVPLAWISFLAFGVVCVSSILYLAQRRRRWDVAAAAAAEIGVVCCALVLITGSMWGRSAWNTWWTWDPRLTTTLILFMIYLSYLVLRQAYAGSESGPRLAAVLGIIGFVDVPIVFMAIRWWRTIHPVVLQASGFQMAPSMVLTLMVNLAAFTLLFGGLLGLRIRLGALEEDIEVQIGRLEAEE